MSEAPKVNIVAAMRWDGELIGLPGESMLCEEPSCDSSMVSEQLKITFFKGSEVVVEADYGDWIVKTQSGEFRSCKPSMFKQEYEMVMEG